MSFKDSSGVPFNTPDNKPPSGNSQVTYTNGSGQPQTGWWNGTNVIPNKN